MPKFAGGKGRGVLKIGFAFCHSSDEIFRRNCAFPVQLWSL
jgi:hypothetical protein